MISTKPQPVEAETVFERAATVLAGGVSASMRLHPYLGKPLYVSRGEGPYLYGLDGKRYIDLNMSNGAALLGHDQTAKINVSRIFVRVRQFVVQGERQLRRIFGRSVNAAAELDARRDAARVI